MQKEGEGKKKKRRKKKLMGPMTWPLMWLNKNVATINTILQLFDIYRYRFDSVIFFIM